MLESTSTARLVLTAVASPEEAARMGHALVEERLAACATIVPALQSIYHWKGTIETAAETLLLLKTVAGQLPALEARVCELHEYDTPEFLVLKVDAGSQRYLAWLHASLDPSERV